MPKINIKEDGDHWKTRGVRHNYRKGDSFKHSGAFDMDVNIPEIVEEVTAAFMSYEKAITENDVEMINHLFWNDAKTLRYGPNGTLISHEALSAFRRNRVTDGVRRILKNTSIVTFGRDYAVANTEANDENIPGTVRQSQTWLRTDEGWKIVSAHVSYLQDS